MSARVRTGLDRWADDGFESLLGKTIGVVCNQASIDARLRHLLDLLLPLHQKGKLKIKAVFGPQHGLRGHTQDNMIEWEGEEDSQRHWEVFSLYGAHREPTAPMLDGLDCLVLDLQDVGARYYTFLWTLALCMKACARLRVPIYLLDRPNPIGGDATEGPFATTGFESFVGLHPLLARHGCTLGELARWLQAEHYPQAHVDTVPMEGWVRSMRFENTELPWLPPSPNMPTPQTALVYPGGCLLEGTNLSEGRGTTRPFEIVGAPYLDSDRFARALNDLALPGVHFLPYNFQPTFQKHAGELCGGVFQYVTEPERFHSVLAVTAILLEAKRQAPKDFDWRSPPYEYELEKLPIDILSGGSWLREWIDADKPLIQFEERFATERDAHSLRAFHMY